ncbi:hypothetical protein Nepgr_028928 [Nepenthes gracilis]|uniref:Uncharacterized protein n=1 Tax=Nepenthes gracilis TaxID=150966 RepID=A0AAD3TCL9_NEPGR|nr:hypothetical protein Nepgr_028928 [Nepenthes gracilis]
MLTDIHIDSGKTSNRAMCRGHKDPSARPQMKEVGPQPLGQVTTNFPTQSLSDFPSACIIWSLQEVKAAGGARMVWTLLSEQLWSL